MGVGLRSGQTRPRWQQAQSLLSTLAPAATRRSSRVVTNRDDQTVAAPVSSTDTPKTTLYG